MSGIAKVLPPCGPPHYELLAEVPPREGTGDGPLPFRSRVSTLLSPSSIPVERRARWRGAEGEAGVKERRE